LGASLGAIFSAHQGFNFPFGAGIGFLAIIFFPVLYGFMGFVAGILSALIYNLVAKWVGGIEIELKDKSFSQQL
jgi:hypothetical protein